MSNRRASIPQRKEQAMPEPEDEFYVGYLPKAPPQLARRVRWCVAFLFALCTALAVLLVRAQSGFGSGVFEWGTERDFSGVIEIDPYPVLAVERPGAGRSRYLLSAVGKHGAMELAEAFDGSAVQLRGTLVYRDGMTMIEIAESGVRAAASTGAQIEDRRIEFGEQTLVGEIVDSKCYLGVMKPGNTKAHRDCAVRCISGGIPPVLLVRDERGNASYFLLVGAGGESVNSAVLDMVAEPVEIRGKLVQVGDQLSLRADPASYRRLP
jgi:hypothetical protein